MGLQTDAEGNFYYAKAARHGKTAVVPQHGTLLKVSQDGSKTEILATGFRAPNGVCLNPDGTFFVTDQEGLLDAEEPDQPGRAGRVLRQHVGLPRRHRPVRRGDGAAGLLDHQRVRPLARPSWSGSTGKTWGPLDGSLLNLSYGDGQGLRRPARDGRRPDAGRDVSPCRCRRSRPASCAARFHPTDGQLYVCGMFAWAGNQQAPGGLYRIRSTGKPVAPAGRVPRDARTGWP